MPFRWKKKRNRFTQLVADHLQSPKNGGSLVVQTGFPTSLIDLYVRNRDRLSNKASEKKRKGDGAPSPSVSVPSPDSLNNSNNPSSAVDSDFQGTGEIIEADVDVNNSVVVVSGDLIVERNFDGHVIKVLPSASGFMGSHEVMEGDENLDAVNEIEEETGDTFVNSNRVWVVAFKILFMVVLALGMKRFTVGLTASAFVLFFLELVAKQFFGKLKFRPFWVGKESSDYCVCETKPNDQAGDIRVISQGMPASKENLTPVVCNEVLEIEEEELDLKERAGVEKDKVSVEKQLDEDRCEVQVELRPKCSHRDRMKSKIRKLVPKKLRDSKKGSSDVKDIGQRKEDSGQDSMKWKMKKLVPKKSCNSKKGSSYVKDVGRQEEGIGQQDNGVKGQCQPLVLLSSSSKGETFYGFKEEQDNVVEIERQSLPSKLSSEIDHSGMEELGTEKVGDSGYLVLCLIVLVGLMGGRIFALVLALSWCLLINKTQRRRYVKLSISS